MNTALATILAALAGKPVLMSSADLAACLLRAAHRLQATPVAPWDVRPIARDGVGGGMGDGEGDGEDVPTYPALVKAAMLERLSPLVETEDGVTQIHLCGPIMADPWSAWCMGGLWTEAVCEAMEKVAEQAGGTVVVREDCPGGSHAGMYDLVASMKRLCAARDVVMLAQESACSLGYLFGCIAPRVVATPTAFVGSIGSRVQLVSYAEMQKKAGIDVRTLSTGSEKTFGDPSVPITEEALAFFQSIIDENFGQFAEIVAEHRGVSVESLRGMDGWCGRGQDLIAKGLVDEIVTDVEAFLDGLTGGGGPSGAGRPAVLSALSRGGSDMPATVNTVKDLRDQYPKLVTEVEDSVKATARDEAVAAARRPASLAELQAKFGGDDHAAFVLKCATDGITLAEAIDRTNGVLKAENEKLRKELAESKLALDAVGQGVTAAGDRQIPGDPGKGGGGGGGGDSLEVDGVKLEGKARGFYLDLKKKVEDGAKTSDAMGALAKSDPEGHRAYAKAGSPGVRKLKAK